MPDQITPPAEDAASHLEDAKAFFKETAGVVHADTPAEIAARGASDKPADKPVDKPADKPAPQTTPSLLDGIFQSDKPAEKPADTPSEDVFKGLNAPDDKSKFKPDWDKARGVAEQHRKEAAELKVKLEAAEAKLKGAVLPEADAATRARLTELETQNKVFGDRLKVFDVQQHPDFQREFVHPRAKAVADASAILKEEGIQGDVAAVLTLKGKAFAEASSKLAEQVTPFNQPSFIAYLRQVQQLDAGAAQAVANADQYRAAKTQEFQARARGTFDQVSSKFGASFLPVQIAADATPEFKAEATAYNNALAARSRTAEQYAFGQLNDQAAAEIANKAASFDFLMGQAIPKIARLAEGRIAVLQQQLTAAQTELASVTSQKPSVRPTGAAGGAPSEDGDLADLDHKAAARRVFRS